MKKIVVALDIREGVSPELFVNSVVETYGGVKSARTARAKDLANVRDALERFQTELKYKHDDIAKYADPDGGEPLCGYSDWDELMYDHDERLAELGEHLAGAVEELLK